MVTNAREYGRNSRSLEKRQHPFAMGFPKTRSLRLLVILISSWAILQNLPTYSVGFPSKRQFHDIDSIRAIALKSFSVKPDTTKAGREGGTGTTRDLLS